MRWTALAASAAWMMGSAAMAGQVLQDVPAQPDPEQQYLFYLHGLDVEKNGPFASNAVYGASDYHGVVKALAERGFTVISEVRSPGTDARAYADKIKQQVASLRRAGVPGGRIAVTGFSKGGMITLLSAAALRDPDIRFVVMAGCARDRAGRNEFARRMQGRMLSLFDRDDRDAGSCETAFASAGEGFKGEEIVLPAGGGHALFYRPRPEWIDPVVRWLKQ